MRPGTRPVSLVQDPDQVARKLAFLRRHPEIRIIAVSSRGGFQALIPVPERDGEDVMTRQHLSDLLDELEERFPPQAGG